MRYLLIFTIFLFGCGKDYKTHKDQNETVNKEIPKDCEDLISAEQHDYSDGALCNNVKSIPYWCGDTKHGKNCIYYEAAKNGPDCKEIICD